MFSAVTDRLADNILQSLYKIQFEVERIETHSLRSRRHFGDEKYDYCRLKLMVQRHLEHKIKDSHFKARNRDEDRPAIGAPSKGKAQGKGKDNVKNNFKRGDCIRWTTRPMDFGDSCASKHDPSKKGKREGTTSATFSDRSATQHSKGYGKGSDH